MRKTQQIKCFLNWFRGNISNGKPMPNVVLLNGHEFVRTDEREKGQRTADGIVITGSNNRDYILIARRKKSTYSVIMAVADLLASCPQYNREDSPVVAPRAVYSLYRLTVLRKTGKLPKILNRLQKTEYRV